MPRQIKRVHFAPNVTDGSHRPPVAFQKKHSQPSCFNKLLTSISSLGSKLTAVSYPPPSLPTVSPLSSCIKGAPKKCAPQPKNNFLTTSSDIPFSRWFVHYSTTPSYPWHARGFALLNSIEGLVRTIKDVACWCFYKMTCQGEKAQISANKAKQQWEAMLLSGEAIIRPYAVIEKFQNQHRNAFFKTIGL